MIERRTAYLDLLLVAALATLLAREVLGRPWLLPAVAATAVLFAVAGGQAAALLDRRRRYRGFLLASVRRLLAPFWLFGAGLVALMLVLGWRVAAADGSEPLDPATAWRWLLPLSDPPASALGVPWVSSVWVLRIMLWLLLLTPAALWLFRRWPLRLLTVPVLTLLLVAAGLVTLSADTRAAVTQACAYGCCWLLGAADRDGALRRLPLLRTLAGGAVLVAAGVAFARWQEEAYGSSDPNDIPVALLLITVGAVLVLLRLDPPMRWLRWLPGSRALLAGLSACALTVYLWGSVALDLAPLALRLPVLADLGFGTSAQRELAVAGVLLLCAVLLLGWLEALVAGRLPVLRRRARAVPRPVLLPEVVFEDNVVGEAPATDGGAPPAAQPPRPRTVPEDDRPAA